jgi:hypothetical protein
MTRRLRTLKLSLLASFALLGACAVSGGGYGGSVDVGYAGGYYDPCCYDYGGWGGNYWVGPPRGGGWHPGGPAGRPGPRPPEGGHPGGGHPGGGHPGGGRPAPSIPGHPRR